MVRDFCFSEFGVFLKVSFVVTFWTCLLIYLDQIIYYCLCYCFEWALIYQRVAIAVFSIKKIFFFILKLLCQYRFVLVIFSLWIVSWPMTLFCFLLFLCLASFVQWYIFVSFIHVVVWRLFLLIYFFFQFYWDTVDKLYRIMMWLTYTMKWLPQ